MIRRGARRFDSEGVVANLDHVACENPDGQKVLVMSNTAATRPVVLQMGAMEADLTLAADSVTTLTWK
jgi:O-glycosyl hydrolase